MTCGADVELEDVLRVALVNGRKRKSAIMIEHYPSSAYSVKDKIL